MISPEQLAEALDRIHPRDRELLSLSLRRRVPDEALGRLYDCESTEVARRRAGAIERLADELELQRGEDLGAVLKALLEPGTWSAAAATAGEEFAAEAGVAGGPPTAVPPPDDAEISASGPALARMPARAEPREEDAEADAAPEAAEAELAEAKVQPADAEAEPAETEPAEAEPAEAEPAETEPAETEPAEAEPAEAEAEPAAPPSEPAAPEPAPPPESAPGAPAPEPQPSPTVAAATSPPQPPDQPDPDVLPPPDGPVLEMLAAREPQVPDSPRRAVTLALLGIGVAGLVGAGGVVGATQFGETNRLIQSEAGRDSDDATRHFTPEQGGFLAAPFPTDPSTVSCYSIANVPGSTVLYRRPGGKKRVRITPRTEWGSPRVLGVIKQRGAWLAVQAPELRNGELAWARREDAQLDCVRWSLHADLSDRTLSVRHDGRTVRKMQVAIGRRENPTPEGRFTVTDKLRVTDPNSAYGCCVIALSGHQTDLPAYWPGGDRLAVHATADESSIGRPVSLGCMRTDSHRARWLIRTIPLGAPMFITA